jgi:hypothetical protein
MGYLIRAIPTEIITAKVTLTSANLLTPGYIYSIPEFPKIAGYFWNVIYMNGEIVNGTTPYTGTSAIHIQAAAAANFQFRFPGGYMNGAVGTFGAAVIAATAGQHYAPDDNLQIHNPGTLTLGDTELNIYIGANLIQY